jgi:CSLREA domain-containing protein
MYQLNDSNVWREHRDGLLEEAEDRILARRLRRVRNSKGRSRFTAALGFLAVLLVAGLLVLEASSPARADTTFTVSNPFDPGDGNCNTSCTLREAITAANNTPGADTINFNIPGEGVKTISPTPELPAITDEVTIDGYTQPGASPNTLAKATNAKIMVELDGSNAGPSADGLQIEADDVVVMGLAINRFALGGIHLSDDVSGVKVEGNFIGTDPSGTQGRGNSSAGLGIEGGRNNIVGGTTPEARNLISGNRFSGVLVVGGGANRVQGNLIGTSKDGKSPLGNGSTGVHFISSSNNTIGGAEPSSANTIAFNGLDGVFLSSASSGNRVLGNSIFTNAQLGIDLSGGSQNSLGETVNDPGDADEGPNGLQNKPVIASAKTSGGTTILKGRLDSTSNTAFTLQFFANSSGEGKKFIGQKRVTTSSESKVSFTFSPAQKVGAGQPITATATGAEGTSEFSAPKTVTTS